jgi:hypothetical protein
MRTHVLAALVVALVPASALAQTANPAANTGPLVLQRIDNGMLIAPDYKITSFDGKTGQLLGATGGWSQENTLFLGGAWYWLANGAHDRELTYGGFVVGWTVPSESHFQVGGRSLIGFGTATLGVTYPAPILVPSSRDARIRGGSPPMVPITVTRQYLAWDDFFVFEPQGSFRAVINRHTRLSLAAGYRVTGGGDVLEDRLNGVTGNIAVEFRFF